MSLRREDWRDMGAVTLLAALARFPGLFSPRMPVWDEAHTLTFVRAYLSGSYYLDVHPPLGIQLFAAFAHLLGYNGATLPMLQPLTMRLLPAVVGTALVPLTWLLLRRLDASRRTATLGATCVALDNALVLQSRLMLTDMLLVTFAIGAVTLWLGTRDDASPRWGKLAATGVLGGMAFATKWTGLSALGVILLFEACTALAKRQPARRAVARAAMLAACALAVYAIVFAVHFAIVDRAYHAPFLAKLWQRQGLMLSGNASIATERHFYASPWYSWPLMIRPIHYWMSNAGPGRGADIYLIGNPLVWWGSIAILLGTLAGWARSRDRRPALALLATAFAINLLPFAAIHRPMFLYHYLLALVFAIAIAAKAIGARAGWTDSEPTWSISSARRDLVFWGALAAVAVTFIFFAPLTYSWSLTPAALKLRLWLPGWG